jgi:AraC family transcriptional regulator
MLPTVQTGRKQHLDLADTEEGATLNMLEQISYHLERASIQRPSLQSVFGPPVFVEVTPCAAEVASPAPLQAKPLASVVIKLLDRAAETLDTDRAAAKDCIARASALLQAECDGGGHARGGLAPWQVRQVIRHIDASLASTLRTRDCAKISRLSASHFSRAFKVSFGETFARYISRRRTERAQEMMMMTDERLCQIALSCGFADQSHFTRVYHRQVGSSPASWRRQRQIRAGLSIEHSYSSIRSDRPWPQRG